MSAPTPDQPTPRPADRHAEFERIEPAAPARAPDPRTRREAPTAARRSPLALGALAVLLAALGFVFFVLPSRMRDPVARVARPAVVAEPVPAPEPHPDVDQTLARRAELDALAGALAERRSALSMKSHQRWDPDGARELERVAASAAAALGRRDLDAATTTHRRALELAEQALERADAELAAALARGEQAIRDGDAADAMRAFDRALTVAPQSAEAARGRRRAGTLDEVTAKVALGRERESARDLDGAREALRAALALDADAAAAAAALRRVETAIAERAFRAAISRGLHALEAGDARAARSAFRAADAIRPGSPEVADGLAGAAVALETDAVAALRDEALGFEAEERWDLAVAAYEKALGLDGTLAFAREGKVFAAERAALAARLEAHLARPERLESREVREAAAALLVEATAIDDPGPRHREAVASLGTLLARARTRVPVRLDSDGETEVLVYRVGRLGRFASKEIELTPGTYTVVGRREGFRDVRLEVRVAADGGVIDPVVVRCEERI